MITCTQQGTVAKSIGCIPFVFFVFSIALQLPCPAQEKEAEAAPDGKEIARAKALREKHDAEAAVRIANFTMPEDIKADLFADSSQTQNPGAICFDHNGRLYIAEVHRWRAGVEDIRYLQRLLFDDIACVTVEDRLAMHQRDQLARPISHYTEFDDRIVVVDDTDKDGRADQSEVWAKGFNQVVEGPGIGLLAVRDGSIFYTNIPNLWKLKDTDKDGAADEKISIQNGFGPRISFSGHDMHGLTQGPDGRIYWSIGDRGYTITTKEGRHYSRPMEGAVFRCDPDGSNVEEYYRGLRNPQELAFDQFGNLFTCDNDADYWDTGRLVYIIEGGDSGWNHGHQALMNFKEPYQLRTPEYEFPDHQRIPMSPWMTEGIWDPNAERRPEFALPAIDKVSWGPSGLVFNYGVTAMPDRYANHFWVCNFGGANGDLEAFSVKPDGAGFALDHHEEFMVGLGNTDVEFGPDGKLYLCCFNNNGWVKQDIGNIYTLFAENKLESEKLAVTRMLLVSDFREKRDDDLALLLAHEDMRVRKRAQFELTARRNSDVFKAAVEQFEHRLKRLHGVWGMGQLARQDESLYQNHINWLNDSDDEVRAQSAKVLADSRLNDAGKALAAALDDVSPRVRVFAAIGTGKCGNPQAIPKLIELLAKNDNQDLFLRHGIVQGLWYLNEKEKILKLVNHESPAVRLGVVLTLRKLEDPRISYFLDDPEETVRFAAIRAINDLDLSPAAPALAAHLDRYIEKAKGYRMPEDHRDWIIQHRLINANFRTGTEAAARRLVEYAASRHLPELMRGQALDALAEWPQPNQVDATVGFFRPLDPAKRADISKIVQEEFSEVWPKVSGKLLAKASEVALQFGGTVPEKLLLSLVGTPTAGHEARISALRALGRQNPGSLDSRWSRFFSDGDHRVRAAASRLLLELDVDRGIESAFKLADSKDLRDRQAAFRNLAAIETPEVGSFFENRLGKLSYEPAGAALDLLEAAAQRKEEPVKKLLSEYNSQFAANPLAAYDVCIEGGDPDRGKMIFLTHAAGQCAKCHRIDKDGGEAGPDLSDVAKRGDAKYILDSLINPSASVVPGYGLTMVTKKDGSSTGGTLLEEDKEKVVIRVTEADGQQKEVTFPKDEIVSLTPPISAMPPMNGVLRKDEIRDLVAYLSQLDGSKKSTKKNHQ